MTTEYSKKTCLDGAVIEHNTGEGQPAFNGRGNIAGPERNGGKVGAQRTRRVAPVQGVALPKLAIVVVTPALETHTKTRQR